MYYRLVNVFKCSLRHYSSKVNPWKNGDLTGNTHIEFKNGKLTLGTGQLARFADGCATAQLGDSAVMVTAVGKEGSSYRGIVPLTVDYRQKSAAAGRIPTNHLRREMGSTDAEILTGRMIDRSLRPLFPTGFNFETQIVCNMLAVDGLNNPDILSINAASAALALSDIPWNGPIGAVRVGLIDHEIVINPTRKDLRNSLLNLVIAATGDKKVVMIEASGENVSQGDFVKAMKTGVTEAQNIVTGVQQLQQKYGKPKRPLSVSNVVLDQEIKEAIKSMSEVRIKDVFTDFTHHKISRDKAIAAIKEEILSKIKESYPTVDVYLASDYFSYLTKDIFRQLIFDTNLRCDGRSLVELRPISCSVDLYAPLHGSALFQRGQTQVMCTATFDAPDAAAKVDTVSSLLSGVKEKNFFLHYEFPQFATNEIGRPGAIGRRELGHGALAEKALRPIVPRNYPFTIRLTAEVLESNGSSSMASVCGGSLALLDAGVNISEPASGVAVGLVTKTDPQTNAVSDYRLLTDLLGIEDYMGDMDFKMAGTRAGITALQADVKPAGLPLKILVEAVKQATDGINQILDIMNKTISKPRESKPNRPVVEKLEVPIAKRSKLVGVSGLNLRQLTAETGVSVSTIDETTFNLFAPHPAAMVEAKERIAELLADEREPELEFGAIYRAKIVEIRDIGVMVQLYPNMVPTLIHNSQLDQRKVSHASALGIEVNQEIPVKYFGRDPVSGKMRLSRKVLQSPSAGMAKNLLEKKKQ